MKTALRRIGNSQGVILPKPILAQLGLAAGELEMTVEQDAIVLRKPKRRPRAGWAQAAKRLAAAEEDRLVWPEFRNEADSDLTW